MMQMMNETMSRMAVPTVKATEPKQINCREVLASIHNEVNEITALSQNLAGFIGVEPPAPVDTPITCLPEDLGQISVQLEEMLMCLRRVCGVLGL